MLPAQILGEIPHIFDKKILENIVKISRYIASYWNIVKYRVYRKKAVLLMGEQDIVSH